jgi:hypothetical protein
MALGPRLVRVVAVAAAASAVIVGGLLLVLQTGWARARLAGLIAAQAERYVDADVSIATIEGDLFGSAALRNVVVTRDGRDIISVERVELSYDLLALLGGALALNDVTLERPVIDLTGGPEGLALAGLFTGGRPPDASPAASRPFLIDPIVVVDARVVIGPSPEQMGALDVPDRLEQLNARLSVAGAAGRTTVQVEHLSLVAVEPHLELRKLSGGVVIGPDNLAFDNLSVETAASTFALDGTVANFRDIGAR